MEYLSYNDLIPGEVYTLRGLNFLAVRPQPNMNGDSYLVGVGLDGRQMIYVYGGDDWSRPVPRLTFSNLKMPG